jgi:hypothetical protein
MQQCTQHARGSLALCDRLAAHSATARMKAQRTPLTPLAPWSNTAPYSSRLAPESFCALYSRISTGTDVGGMRPDSVITSDTYFMGVRS